MKKVFLFFAIVLMGFASCSKEKDENDGSPQEAHFVGKWQMVKVEALDQEWGVDNFGCKPPVLVFNADGTATVTIYEKNDTGKCEADSEGGSWHLENDMLVTDSEYSGKVVSISASQFVLGYTEAGILIKLFFKRI